MIKGAALKLVILKEQDCQRNQWPLARTTGVHADRNDSVTHRVADLNNGGKQTLRKAITKNVISVKNEIDFPSKGAIRINQDETSTS